MNESAQRPTSDSPGVNGRVMVVDDNPVARVLHSTVLSKSFEIVAASSGAEAIKLCSERLPDLVLLDVEMPDMGGYETCRRLREMTDIPIIFATAHQDIEEHMKAYDAGGNDIVTKPIERPLLLRKVELAINHHRKATQLVAEKDSLHKMAMGFLSTVGENGALLEFMRASATCRSHRALAEKLLQATDSFSVECSVMIRHDGGPTMLTSRGDPTPLECSVLEQAAGMGRVFQFKRRLVVNYDRVSIIVGNMPDEVAAPEQAGRLRDNVTILAESAEAMCENVDMRIESTKRAEQLQVALGGAVTSVEALRQNYIAMLGDVRLLLQVLVDDVERTYAWLETNHAQEAAISATMDSSIQKILAMLAEGSDFESQFANVLAALRGGSAKNDLELF